MCNQTENHNGKGTFSDSEPRGRLKLAFDWIPEHSETLLDGGCAWGYGTRFFKLKCRVVYGLDPNKDYIKNAKANFGCIKFVSANLEHLPFRQNHFDVVLLLDVLEHVTDELKTLNEVFRVLKSNGMVIITTPHKGLFSFLDSDNYVFFLRNKMPTLYRILFRMRNKKAPEKLKPGYEDRHRHYSFDDLKTLLDESYFRGNYEIVEIFRSGLFTEPFTANLRLLLSLFLGIRLSLILTKPFTILSNIDHRIYYGGISYNIAIKLRRIQ
ncbi:MAG: methyltransferase domain-containing protein [Aliifodinibius sp.]|nr:class I SAM-dependent methyltransferase [Fodinibius sp.]NIV15252.1 methyltransferase domain-containing protein [Fodinibius sp.]NIY29126.1 methyltransferase domain-containing protein [Fodinibius sp.]